MTRRWNLRLFASVVFIGLALYFLSSSMSLMLNPPGSSGESAARGYLRSWRSFNLSRIKGNSRNGSRQSPRISERNDTFVKAAEVYKGPFKLAPSSTDFRKVKVLCWIMTSPQTLHTRANHVKETWGPRCDVTLFMSTVADRSFPAIALDVKEGRNNLWNKTRAAFKYVYDNHFRDADWFMKADDDTYVIAENLRYFLRDKNSSAPVYYGHNFKLFMKQGYMSGGAGYVLSREALRRFVTGMEHHYQCREDYTAEDVGTGLCMQAVGVVAGDSRDSLNRSRFLPLKVDDFVNRRVPQWYYHYKKYDIIKGPGCCSDYLISCHYVTPNLMHFLDYAVYHLRSATDNDHHAYKTQNNRTLPI